jgi:hypothetical protein
MPAPFTINPRTQPGSGVFGSVPGPVGLPQPYNDVGKVLPGLQPVAGGVSNDVLSELSGQLSPETLASIKDQGAAFGIQSGMPGSGVVNNYDLALAGQTSMAQQQQGQTAYGSVVGPESRYLTVSPSTEVELAEVNALNAAKGNPTETGLSNIGAYIGGLGFSYAIGGGGSGVGASGGAGGVSYDNPELSNYQTEDYIG